MRCPICGEIIDEFYADVIFKESVKTYRVTENGVEIIDEEEQEAWAERCYCPSCFAEFTMTMNDAQDLLKGNAILVDLNNDMKIIEAETEFGYKEEVAIIKINNELYFSDPLRFKVIIRHNKPRIMLLFYRKYPIKIKLPANIEDKLRKHFYNNKKEREGR